MVLGAIERAHGTCYRILAGAAAGGALWSGSGRIDDFCHAWPPAALRTDSSQWVLGKLIGNPLAEPLCTRPLGERTVSLRLRACIAAKLTIPPKKRSTVAVTVNFAGEPSGHEAEVGTVSYGNP